jgi:hypothetical protein
LNSFAAAPDTATQAAARATIQARIESPHQGTQDNRADDDDAGMSVR